MRASRIIGTFKLHLSRVIISMISYETDENLLTSEILIPSPLPNKIVLCEVTVIRGPLVLLGPSNDTKVESE